MTITFDLLNNADELNACRSQWIEFISNDVVGSNLSNHPAKILMELELNPKRELRTLVVREDENIVAIAPFFIEPGVFWVTLSVLKLLKFKQRKLRLFGSAFILRAHCDHASVTESIFSYMVREVDFDVVYLHHVDCSQFLWRFINSPVLRQFGLRMTPMNNSTPTSFLIEHEGNYEAYLQTLGKKSRQNLQRTTRKLFREQNARVELYRDESQVAPFLDDLDTIFKNTWQARTFGYKPRNDRKSLDFYQNIAREGWLRSYILYIDDQPVAFEHVFQFGQWFEFRECGFDSDWSSYGVGSIAILLALKDIFDETDSAVTVDFGIGEAPYKKTFGNQTREIAAVNLYSMSAKAFPVILQKYLLVLERLIRELVRRFNIERFVRKLLKRQ